MLEQLAAVGVAMAMDDMGGDVAMALAAQHRDAGKMGRGARAFQRDLQLQARELGAETGEMRAIAAAVRDRTSTSSTRTASPASGDMRTWSRLAPAPSTISNPTLRKSA